VQQSQPTGQQVSSQTGSTQAAQTGGSVVLAWDNFDPSIQTILEAAVQPQDYINREVAGSDKVLLERVGWSHVYEDPASNSTPAPGSTPAPDTIAAAIAGCPTSATIFYDIEHWANTPVSQQDNPVAAIGSAVKEVNAGPTCASDGFSSFSAGIAPDGEFSGWYSCGERANASSEAFYDQPNWVNTGPGNSWQPIGFYDVQSQTLLAQSPWDACYGSVQTWWSVVSKITAIARAGNPSIKVWAHVSFGDETATMMAAAITYAQAQSAPPDAYVVLYPDNATTQCPNPYAPPTPAPHSWKTRCTFDSPAQLQQFANAMGRPTPVP
jgi:hypothetical protein